MANGINYNFVSGNIKFTKNNNNILTINSSSVSSSLIIGNTIDIVTPIISITSSENLQNYQNIHKFIINNNIENINLYNPIEKNGKEIILFNKGNDVVLSTNKFFNELQILSGSSEVVGSGDYFGASVAANSDFSKIVIGSPADEKILSSTTGSGLSLLLHMDDVSGSTVFIDSSPNNFSITTAGNTIITSSQSKFGGYSAYFDGNGDGLTVVNGSQIAFGNLDFTIESWVYNLGNGQVNFFETRNGSEGAYPVFGIGNDAKFYWYLNNNYVIVSDTSQLNTWNHVAVSRKNGVTKMFLNGTQSGVSYSDSNNYVFPRLLIGTYNFGAAGSFYGFLDEFRIINGTALYTSSFTPPTNSFSNDDTYGNYVSYTTGLEAGLAYVFNSSSNGFSLEQILSGAWATQTGDEFGYSVSINSSGNKIAVGARYDENSFNAEGLVYVFSSGSSGWIYEAVLKGSRVDTSDNFGTCLKINNSGNLLAIGSPFDENPSTISSTGVVYIFRSSSVGWYQEAALNGSRAFGGGGIDYFGISLDFNENANRLFVGAPLDETADASSYFGAGLVYVFNSSSGGVGWQESTYISSDVPLNSKIYRFGEKVSCNAAGDKILISSNNGWTDYPSTLAYLYSLSSSQWVLQQRFSGSKVSGDDRYSPIVKLNYSGNMAYIGSFNSEILKSNNSSGLVYNYISGSSGWKLNTIIYGSYATQASDNFGYSIFCNDEGNKVLIGAINDELSGNISNYGLVYYNQVSNNYPYSADYLIDDSIYYVLPASSSATFISYGNTWYKF